MESLKKLENELVAALPRDICYEGSKEEITLYLNKKAVGLLAKNNANMQEDCAAFEAWALLLKSKGYHRVRLGVKEGGTLLPASFPLTKGHYGRFLYRAMKFSQRFSTWFTLEDYVQKAVNNFKSEILEREALINNAPEKEPGEAHKLEAIVERKFAGGLKPEFIKDVSWLYNQLPVGLFVETENNKPENKNVVFTGGSSAIDLWGIDESTKTMHIIELKAGDNKKLGIISELFFYANYAYDVFCGGFAGNFHRIPIKNGLTDKAKRGYDTIESLKPAKVAAHVLLEKSCCHPQLERILNELSAANDSISFDTKIHAYTLDITFDD